MIESSYANCSITLSHVMFPQDANPVGNVHGGVIMKHIDNAAGVVATRHARCNVVTASIDRLDFHHPVYIGNLLILRACLNLVGTTSMELGVRAEAENLQTGKIRHVASAYLTFVALDEKGQPKKVPPLILQGVEEQRRNREAVKRKKLRLAEKRNLNPIVDTMNLKETDRSYLTQLYESTRGNASIQVSMYDIGAEIGLEKNDAKQVAEELIAWGFVEIRTLAGGIGITPEGIQKVEKTGKSSGTSYSDAV